MTAPAKMTMNLRRRASSRSSTASVAVNAKETVCENSTVEERTELMLDEAWNGPFVDPRVSEPGLQVMLDHPIEGCRLGTARGVCGRLYRLTAFSHEAIVVSGSLLGQETKGIEFPRHNG